MDDPEVCDRQTDRQTEAGEGNKKMGKMSGFENMTIMVRAAREMGNNRCCLMGWF